METAIEKECSALGGLFQSIVTDLRNGVPIWEDFLGKAAKLHGQLKATIIATTAFLDAFQKIADLATNTRGATKDIGTALTRLCLRHKAVEARTKTFTSAIMECLVLPLQDKMEEWKKTVNHLDKEHAKDYKRARQEIKKLSSDTLRLQKKVRKGKSEVQRSLDIALQNVNEKFHALEETEKQALRLALIEERSRFCMFVSYLKPVVDEEVAMLSETSHFQEIMEHLLRNTGDPYELPPSSEQIVSDIKTMEGSWTFHTPPSSPSSISSRKSSTCSVSSVASSSSGSTKCYSPGVHNRCRGLSQQPLLMGTHRLTSVSSQDSGFTSQDTLFLRPRTPTALERPILDSVNQRNDVHGSSSSASTPSSPYGVLPAVTATWPNLQETGHFNKGSCPGVSDRPHTISTAYERGHQRPPLTIHTFEPLDRSLPRQINSTPSSPQGYNEDIKPIHSGLSTIDDVDQPVIPKRAVIISKPSLPSKSSKFLDAKSMGYYAPAGVKIAALPDFNQPAPNQIVPQPLYVNMDEITMSNSSQHEDDVQLRYAPLEEEGYGSIGYDMQNKAYDNSETGFNSDLEQNLSHASKYCTIPRYSNFAQSRHPSLDRRQFSSGCQNSGSYATLQHRSTSLRRSNSQSHKPPPPVRRTSSITSQHALTIVQLRNAQSSQNLSSSTVSLGSPREIEFDRASITTNSSGENVDLKHPGNSPSVDDAHFQKVSSNGCSGFSFTQVPEPPAYEPLNDYANNAVPNVARKSSLPYDSPKLARKASLVEESVVRHQATLIQSLQERITVKRQSLTSPSARVSTQDNKPTEKPPPPVPHQKISNSCAGDSGMKDSFIQNLNPKLALHIQNVQKIAPTNPPPVSPKPLKQDSPPSTENQPVESKRLTFKDELNARLMIQQQGLSAAQPPNPGIYATKTCNSVGNGGVNRQPLAENNHAGVVSTKGGKQWNAAASVSCDPVTSTGHESLLDQIKRGATLKKATTNDRSAPKIR